jgi:hypothetical protein
MKAITSLLEKIQPMFILTAAHPMPSSPAPEANEIDDTSYTVNNWQDGSFAFLKTTGPCRNGNLLKIFVDLQNHAVPTVL